MEKKIFSEWIKEEKEVLANFYFYDEKEKSDKWDFLQDDLRLSSTCCQQLENKEEDDGNLREDLRPYLANWS